MALIEVPEIRTLTAQVLGIDPIKKSGVSWPLAILCHPINEQPIESFIVKLYSDVGLSDPNFGKRCLAKEIFAGFLGHIMGLSVPEMAIIDISNDFITNIESPIEIRNKLNASPGFNFGSKEIEKSIFNFTELPRSLQNRAAEIFAFDLIIGNSDRNNNKHNLFQGKEDFIIFDHEKAFYYSNPALLLGQNPKFWEDPNGNMATVRSHLFYNELKGKGDRLNISNFIENLSLLSEEILYNIIEQIPNEWKSGELDLIVNYLKDASLNALRIEQLLVEILR